MWAVWRYPRTGAFLASESEQRTSGDTSQWTDRYSIASGRSRAPSASMNLPLEISTRSSLSSHGGSTQTVQEKVHSFPLTQKLLSFPWLRRNLLVFLGSVFSWVSNTYIHIFSHSEELHLSIFSNVVASLISPVHSLESANSLSGSAAEL